MKYFNHHHAPVEAMRFTYSALGYIPIALFFFIEDLQPVSCDGQVLAFGDGLRANLGDWIVKDGDKWVVCSNAEFERTYTLEECLSC